MSITLSILISECCLLKFGCLFYMIYLRPQEVQFQHLLLGADSIGGGPTRGIGNSSTDWLLNRERSAIIMLSSVC